MSNIIEKQARRIEDLELELCIVYSQSQHFQGRKFEEILKRRLSNITVNSMNDHMAPQRTTLQMYH